MATNTINTNTTSNTATNTNNNNKDSGFLHWLGKLAGLPIWITLILTIGGCVSGYAILNYQSGLNTQHIATLTGKVEALNDRSLENKYSTDTLKEETKDLLARSVKAQEQTNVLISDMKALQASQGVKLDEIQKRLNRMDARHSKKEDK